MSLSYLIAFIFCNKNLQVNTKNIKIVTSKNSIIKPNMRNWEEFMYEDNLVPICNQSSSVLYVRRNHTPICVCIPVTCSRGSTLSFATPTIALDASATRHLRNFLLMAVSGEHKTQISSPSCPMWNHTSSVVHDSPNGCDYVPYVAVVIEVLFQKHARL